MTRIVERDLCVDVAGWDDLRDLRESVRALLSACPDEVRRASMMVTTELSENALKYGTEVSVTLELRRRTITVKVSNTVTSADRADDACDRVARISQEADPGGLYASRMAELLRDSAETGRLGLYRVAAEGQFRLTCAYTDGRLTTSATRDIHDAAG